MGRAEGRAGGLALRLRGVLTALGQAAVRSWSDTGGTRGPLDIRRPEATDEVLVT